MNVSELIEELKKLPLDAPVRVWDYDRDEGWFTTEVSFIGPNDNADYVVLV